MPIFGATIPIEGYWNAKPYQADGSAGTKRTSCVRAVSADAESSEAAARELVFADGARPFQLGPR